MFKFRRLADYSDGSTRIKMTDPVSGDGFLLDPATNEPKPWPLKGVTVIGELPDSETISMQYVADAVSEGWMEWENHRTVHRPGGNEQNPWGTTHTFHHVDRIHMHLLMPDDGNMVPKNAVYKVIRQPDKIEITPGVWTVDWTYELKLVAFGG